MKLTDVLMLIMVLGIVGAAIAKELDERTPGSDVCWSCDDVPCPNQTDEECPPPCVCFQNERGAWRCS